MPEVKRELISDKVVLLAASEPKTSSRPLFALAEVCM